MVEKPTPFWLWQQSVEEHDGRMCLEQRERYVELLREHGHLVPREPGDVQSALPCGWKPGR